MIHPYVFYPEVNIKSAINVLNQIINKLKIKFPKTKIFDLYSVGYS